MVVEQTAIVEIATNMLSGYFLRIFKIFSEVFHLSNVRSPTLPFAGTAIACRLELLRYSVQESKELDRFFTFL